MRKSEKFELGRPFSLIALNTAIDRDTRQLKTADSGGHCPGKDAHYGEGY